MNRIHRTVWSKARNALIAVSEVTASQGKGAQGGSACRRSRRGVLATPGAGSSTSSGGTLSRLGHSLVAAGLVVTLPLAHALPQNGQVTAGSATIVQGAGSTTIAQTSQNASLNWSSFNVGASERVVFQQPNASAIALNRIADTSASQILGSLSSNGQVFLVNPNGILFGAGAQVSVGGLVASTLGLSDSALANANKTFSGEGTGHVTNLGTIQAAPGSFVALIANQVSNQGSIQAPGGVVALGAGTQVTLQFADNQLLGLTVDRNTLGNLADNQQLIQADGGQVILSAGARDSVLAGVVNNSGRLQARTLQDLTGGVTLVGGQVQQLGTLDVSAPTSGSAGRVRVDGAYVLAGGHIDASSAGGQGGQVSLNAAGGLIQTAQASVNADGATQGGHIAVQGNNTFTSATLSAKGTGAGAHGGTIDVLASNQVALQGVHLDASGTGADNGGLIRIGGDFHGTNPGVVNAVTTLVNGASTLRTDGANVQGGGKVVIWSEAKTGYFGKIEARGGEVEVSSRDVLQFAGDVKARQLLLDPKNITILSGAAATSAAFALVDPNPSAGRYFGQSTTVLGTTTAGVFTPSDRVVVVVTSDNASRGAVYLYDTATGALVSALTGSTANDLVGSTRVMALANGNYVVSSRGWDNGSVIDAGAVTWGSGTTGVSGAVSATNSLVGSTASDAIGTYLIELTKGNYLVSSPGWDNGTVVNVGAVTWGSATTGVSGAVSATNSLVGSTSGDVVGTSIPTLLTNGNYVVGSVTWDNGNVINAGAVTWGSGTTGVSGTISATNSLVGSTTYDYLGSNGRNSYIKALTNGNYVVSSPYWNNGSVIDVGAVTWGNGSGGTVGELSINNSLVGSQAGDLVGRNIYGGTLGPSVTALTNGNYVVQSSSWSNGSIAGAGAATWGSGSTGVTGAVSATNSLVGSTARDGVGRQVAALTNGNYVVGSPVWDNGSVIDAGASTWGNGTTGVRGAVSVTNSLVGSTASDAVGQYVTELTNGNYVVGSPNWHNGNVINAGAVTWGSGATGVSGAVSATNSLVGSTANDAVGNYSDITALASGNYLVRSTGWDNGSVVDAGAVTWGSGMTGVSGTISATNSLVGSTASDTVGQYVTELTNGNYVVGSPNWDNGNVINAGAATWGSGMSGVSGVVSATNSLVGSTASDTVGQYVTKLTTGNYVVGSYNWDNGSLVDAGAATWGNGMTGVIGVVSATNSLVGSTSGDGVGSSVTALTNGHYVVGSTGWDNGSVINAGAATWGSGTSGVIGAVSVTNSLVGSTAYDAVGIGGITALANGNYVVGTYSWDNGSLVNVGAATWGSGTTGVNGAISPTNSLVGSQTSDFVGSNGITALTNGNYVVRSASWDKGGVTDAGAATWGSGTTGISGAITASNSWMGSTANDQFSSGSVQSLSNGQYLVTSPNFNAAAGQVLISVSPVSNHYFANSAGTDVSLDSLTLQNLLANGTAVTLQANNDLTIGSAITVAGSTGGALTLQAGRSILFNANVTTANGNLTAVANDPGAVPAQRDAGSGNIVIASGVSLNVGTGTAKLAGQVFVNNSGASALQTSGAGRWTVWSTNPAADTRGALAYNFKQYNATYGSTALAQATGNGFLYTLAPTLTTSLTGSVSKVYDTNTTASLSGVAYSTTSAVDGDSVTLSAVPASGTFDTKAVGTGKTVTATGLSVTSAVNGVATVYGYGLSGSASGAIGEVTKANLAVTGVTASNRVYDTTTVEALGGTATVAAIGSDVVTVTGTAAGAFTTKTVGTGKAVTVTGFTLSGADAANYTVTQPIGLTADVTKANLAITGVTASNRVYDATTVNALGGTATVVALGSDVVTVTGSAAGVFATKAVGTGKAVTVTGLTLSGADAANYMVVQPTGLTADITKANLAVTGITASNRVYNATTVNALGGSATVAALGSDVVTVTGGTGAFATKTVGTGKAVTVTGLTLSGADAANYMVIQPTGLTADVTKANLAVTGVTASNRVYDTTTVVALGGTATVAALGSDVVTVTGTVAGAFATKPVGTGKAVTVTGLTLSGTDAANYTVIQPIGLTADVTQANLAVTGVTASNRVYDATTVTALGGTATLAALGSDVVTVTGTAAGAFANKTVGTGKAVTVTGLTLSGADAANYMVVQPTGLTADITKANLAVTGITASNRVYDATTVNALGGSATVAALGRDVVTVIVTGGTGAFATKTVGTGKAVTVTGLTLSGADAANYTVIQPTGLTADVTKANLAVTGVTASNRVYDETTVQPLGGTAMVAAIGTDVVTVTGTAAGAFATKTVGTGKVVTVTGLTLSGADAANYTLIQPTGLSADITALVTPPLPLSSSADRFDPLGMGLARPSMGVTDSPGTLLPTGFTSPSIKNGIWLTPSEAVRAETYEERVIGIDRERKRLLDVQKSLGVAR